MDRKIIVSMGHNQEDDGTWRVDLCISGMKEEAPALGFLVMLEELLCGDEIKAN